MNNKKIFENFLESLKGKEHDTLIETVKKGFQTFFESELGKTPTIELKYNDLSTNLKRALSVLDAYDAKIELPIIEGKINPILDVYIDIQEFRMEIGKLEKFLNEFKDTFISLVPTYTGNKLKARFIMSEKDINEMNISELLKEKTTEESNTPEPQPPENVS